MTAEQEFIDKLRPYWDEDPRIFEFKASMFLGGDHNKIKRQDIIYHCTGNKPPKSKASLTACVNAITKVYTQPTLF